MAYQNVGTPRFIIDYLTWFKSLGFIAKSYLWNAELSGGSTDIQERTILPNIIGLDPTTIIDAFALDNEYYGFNYNHSISSGYVPVESVNIVGFFGHNFADVLNTNPNFMAYFSCTDWYNGSGVGQAVYPTFEFGAYGDDAEISINSNYTNYYMQPRYNGWSLQSVDAIQSTYNNDEYSIVSFDGIIRSMENPANNHIVKLGSMLIGRYYTMPHSPELKLTMTREMDGVKRVRTKGGNDLVHHKYLKSPMWGDLAPWELSAGGETNQELSRVGRRSWDLSFNYMQGSDMFGSNEMLGVFNSETGTYHPDPKPNTVGDFDTDDIVDTGAFDHFQYNLLTDDNFFSQVIHKTNGGALPFIFQPDSNNNNPDQFAICKLDMKSFKFTQVAGSVYNIKLKIREVW